MSNRRVLQAPARRRRPAPVRQWSIWDWMFGGFYNGG
jgi:hypothetical protein